jgi:hypothetical protein
MLQPLLTAATEAYQLIRSQAARKWTTGMNG